jgi:cytoskeleton protein RodZ
MSGELPAEMRIGEVLKQARARAGLDIRTVEERTKIRVKYLRALEDEEWDALPSPAYAKGFLRTYGLELGLDGDALADAYRRQVEGAGTDPSYPLGEQVLERRRRLADESSRPAWLLPLVAMVVIVGGVLAAIGLLGGGDENAAGPHERGGAKHERKHRGRGAAPAAGTVALGLSIHEPVQVCLVGGGGQALIDGQVLNAGDEESYERERFELRFPSGFDPSQFTLEIAGKPRTLPKANGPASYEIIAPQRVVAGDPPGKQCP